MTAVASPPTFPQISRPAWGTLNGNNAMNPDEVRDMFVPRKALARSNSSGSVSSNASTASNTTVATNGSHSNGTPVSSASDLSQWSANAPPRKRPQPKGHWSMGKPEAQPDFPRHPVGRPNGMVASHGPLQQGPGPQAQMSQQGMMRPMGGDQFPAGQPVLSLLSLNGTFERKTIAVPFAPDSLRIGRQTNQKTVPTASNGFFDSKVLSRQHAEVYAERNGKIYIRDVKSSNGTFVNGTRLSQENRESEPHELQTADHLELGIDIVSEDQKTVVHHKVAAKVEHAGFLSNTNSVLDMNFGDLDPANGAMLMPAGAVQMRGRAGSNMSMGSNGRMMMMNGGMMGAQPGLQPQRSFLQAPIATDQILKRLSNEMRSARIQAQDLNRTNQFIDALLSKDDVKDLEKPEIHEPSKPQHQINGISSPFRPDAKTRFSEPPAPPPQQPLPEKPDVPSLKRGPTERPKSGPPNTSPVRQENLSQIIQLTEALNNAKREFDSQSVRMRELEQMLQKEREARELAEDLARRLENSTAHQANGIKHDVTSDPAEEEATIVAEDQAAPLKNGPEPEVESKDQAAQETAIALQSRIDSMEGQMRDLKEQMNEWKQRCENAESERDADRKTLAEMVIQLREEEARTAAEKEKARSRSRRRRNEAAPEASEASSGITTMAPKDLPNDGQTDGMVSGDDFDPTLSRANTITPMTSKVAPLHDQHLQASLPYASMLGVVLIGMGLMAYINGWQSPPPRIER